jgi:hypothetical protein
MLKIFKIEFLENSIVMKVININQKYAFLLVFIIVFIFLIYNLTTPTIKGNSFIHTVFFFKTSFATVS